MPYRNGVAEQDTAPAARQQHEIVRGPGLQGPRDDLFPAVGGREDHRHIGDAEDALHQLRAVASRNQHVWPVVLDDSNGRAGIGGHNRLMARPGRRVPPGSPRRTRLGYPTSRRPT